MTRVAFISGITGQDGWYLSRFLLGKGYQVHGLLRAQSSSTEIAEVTLHAGDIADGDALGRVLDDTNPDEVYHLAAITNVGQSWEKPVETANITGLGALRMLEAVRLHQQRGGRSVKFFHASSSALYGKAVKTPQTELTPFHPTSPYACAKLFAHTQTVNYREAYGMFACNGILFNHESPRRPESFVTRKITRAAARIKSGLQQTLALGDIEGRRDWGFAGDYVEAMWLMLQQDRPDDYVIATGQSHTVRDFIVAAFTALDLDWQKHVETDAGLRRPSEADLLCGDATKACRELGWQPKVSFDELVRMMTKHDLELARREV